MQAAAPAHRPALLTTPAPATPDAGPPQESAAGTDSGASSPASSRCTASPTSPGPYHIRPWEVELLEQQQLRSSYPEGYQESEEGSCGSRFTMSPSSPGGQG